ncbi:MAG: hypothetical protein GY716_22235 [bacterium]|nr:hypothetical protein [bacterium]
MPRKSRPGATVATILRTRLPRFAAEFLLALVVLALLQPLLLPLWKALALTLANLALGLFALRIESVDGGAWTAMRLGGIDGPEKMVSIPAESLLQIYVGFVLLPALLAATPVPWRRRVGLVATGIGLLLIVQAVSHVVFLLAWSRYQQTAPHDALYGTITLIHSIGGQLFSLILWGALTWRVWLGWPGGGSPVQSRVRSGRTG